MDIYRGRELYGSQQEPQTTVDHIDKEAGMEIYGRIQETTAHHTEEEAGEEGSVQRDRTRTKRREVRGQQPGQDVDLVYIILRSTINCSQPLLVVNH